MDKLPTGIREGAFVKFENIDIFGYDVGPRYFQDLSGQARVDALKAATLRYGSPFFAFNTQGYAKSWSKLTPSMFSKHGTSTLYIRVEYPGWTFYPGKDSYGNDSAYIRPSGVPTIIQEINKRNNPYDVAGFNTNGNIKGKMVFPLAEFGSSMIEGSYVRNDSDLVPVDSGGGSDGEPFPVAKVIHLTFNF